MKSNKKKKRTLRKKIIIFTILVVLIHLIAFGVVFFISTYDIVGNYIKNDVSFFLKEVTNNLADKTVLVEDMLLDIRENETIYSYLNNVYQNKETTTNYVIIEQNLNKCIDIYSSKNSGELKKPFVHNVFLFDNNGQFFRTLYDDLIQLDKANLDYQYNNLYTQFNKSQQDVQFFQERDKLIVAYTVYSKFMDNIGTIFFEINITSINQIMSEMNNYKNSFWCVYDKYGNVITESLDADLNKSMIEYLSNHKSNTYSNRINGISYFVHAQTLNMGFRVIGAIPQDVLFSLLIESISTPIIISIILSVIIIIFGGIIIYKLTKPLKEVTDKLKIVGEGNFQAKLPDYNSLEFSNISKVFNTMTDKINFLINDVLKKQLMIKETDFKFLQSQMNPHFMFNVLNTICFKAQMDGNDDIYKMTSSFAQLLQATIYRKDNDRIKLKEEIKYVNYYLYLQSYRFLEKLQYKINYDNESLLDYYIPKLTIQLIVENAVVHGIEKKIDEGTVEVNIFSDDNGITIVISDDGYGFDQFEGEITPPFNFLKSTSKHNRVGLSNAQGILQYFYGKPYGITIFTQKGIGTKVTVKIPFDKGE